MPDRRLLLRAAFGGLAGAAVAGCDSPSSPAAEGPSMTGSAAPGRPRVLLAYFSRAGENYYNGGRRVLTVGNTEVLAGMIEDEIGCVVYRINAVDGYSDSYDATVTRNVREQDADARPAIVDPLDSIAEFDTLLLGSPIWNLRAPMIMSTFTDRYDFAGTTVFPVVTYAVSGLGRTPLDYAAACPGATVRDGLAVRGDEVNGALPAVRSWLQRVGLR